MSTQADQRTERIGEPYLTAREIADALSVTKRTVHSLAHKGELAFYWVGNQMRFPAQSFAEYQARQP